MGLGYDLTYTLGAVLSSPVWGYRMARTGKWRTDWSARLGSGSTLEADARPTLLIHGVSVGEVASVAPIVAALDGEYANRFRTVVSVTTDTGLKRADALFGETHPVLRYPFDLSLSVRRFLDRVNPAVVALTELEVWPNFAEACATRDVPLVVISGRLSDRSYKRYLKVRRWVAPLFEQLAAVGAQTQEYADRFVALGARSERVQVTDSTKWDAAPQSRDDRAVSDLARALGIDPSQPLVVAGSTGPGEERLFVEAVGPDIQLLIAPRKPERFREVAGLADFVLRSESPDGTERSLGRKRFLLDSLGDLENAYALADVVAVGRSFVPLGGSDPIPPVALGCATIVGPHFDNFRDVVNSLVAEEVLRVVDLPGPAIRELLGSTEERQRLLERGPAVVRSREGATARTLQLIIHAFEEASLRMSP